ncbi:p-loop containing nucleoside triphosphate hydrolase protein [Favolaschia claudopus]|uniref:P-loop containing nucleoside triphosphate hydrolase protein n=1 Tax=Favolaschia claudopus TaxID=2862362 RepID=A0AAW0DAR0_9AGAR
MSSLKRSWGTMRIAALPLTRASPPQRIITYYSIKVVPPPTPAAPPRHYQPGWLPKEGVVKWAQYKADGIWTEWGKATAGTWRHRVFSFGERFLDRLDFEEGILKRIDVKHAPPATVPQNLSEAEREEAEAALAKLQIHLLYPPSISSASSALSDLGDLLQKRIPLHRKGVWTYVLIAPFTAPFMIVPIIPNLPFFFCAWRAWSHYQALRGARHVDALLQSGKIVPTAETALDAVYTNSLASNKEKESLPANTTSSKSASSENTSENGANQPKMTVTVTRDSLALAMRVLETTPDDSKDMLRAYEQAIARTQSH